jgi:hypothetical protein
LKTKTERNRLSRANSFKKKISYISSSDEEEISRYEDSLKKTKKETVFKGFDNVSDDSIKQNETPLPSIMSNLSSKSLDFQVSQKSDNEGSGSGYTGPKSSGSLDLETLSCEKVTRIFF